MKISVVIPIYRLSGQRLRNFIFILERLKAAGLYEIIVVEQVAESGAITSVSAITSIPKLIQVVVNDERFCKSILMNTGLKVATGTYVWFHDADIYLPFKKIIDRLNGEVVVKPFNDAWLLSDEQTEDFINSRSVKVDETTIEKMNVFGGGSLLVRRKAAIDVGGWDEEFVGWGYEDAEFGQRLSTVNDPDTFYEFTAVHMHHVRDLDSIRAEGTENRTRYHNSKLLCKSNIAERVTALQTSIIPPPRTPVYCKYPSNIEDEFSMVMCTYGDNPMRVSCVTTVFAELSKQRFLPPIYFVELRYDDSPSPYAQFQSFPWFRHVIVRGSDLHRDIFQKECLNNFGARVTKSKYIAFVDTDCYTDDHYWFWKIYQQVRSAKDTLVQCYQRYNDTVESEQTRISYAHLWMTGVQNLTRGQGMGWAMSRDFYNRMGGFNPWYVSGGGDAAFCIEHLDDHRHSDTILRQRWWRGALRPGQPKASKVECVKVDVLHVYHGPFSERAYYYRRAGVEGVGGVEEYLELDDQGLWVWKPRWRDTKNPLKYILHNKSRMSTVEATTEVIEEAWDGVPLEERERIMVEHIGPRWREAMENVCRGYTTTYKLEECPFKFDPPEVEHKA